MLDEEPTFDLSTVPFQFEYSFSAILITEKVNYRIMPMMTSIGLETFWIDQVEKEDSNGKILEVDSVAKAIHFENEKDFSYPFKMSLLFDNREFFLYCAEIYEGNEGCLQYKTNNEMLLAFNDRKEAMEFEELVTYR